MMLHCPLATTPQRTGVQVIKTQGQKSQAQLAQLNHYSHVPIIDHITLSRRDENVVLGLGTHLIRRPIFARIERAQAVRLSDSRFAELLRKETDSAAEKCVHGPKRTNKQQCATHIAD